MSKRTFASMTEEPCKCGFLEREAHDPDSPIVFDKELNEYQVEYKHRTSGEISHMMIYHCPFCGGAAPESLRQGLFAVISDEEENRLMEMTKDIRTLEDAMAKFGPPDYDEPNSVKVEIPECEAGGPTIQRFRRIIYCSLSDTADVHIIDFLRDRVQVMFQGKYIGSPKENG
jgi:hypothetical protein